MTANIIHGGLPERKERILHELAEQEIFDFQFWEGIFDPTSVVVSINKSHKQIIRYAKEMGLPEVLVFEDDIKFCDTGAFDYFLDNKPRDFDIYLGGIYMGILEADNTVKKFSGFHCYIVHERFYDAYLSVPDDVHIDRGMEGKGKFVVCYPFACVQTNGFSMNTKKEENYDRLLEGRKLFQKNLIS